MTIAYGLDFGTTNSVLATAREGATQSIVLRTPAGETDTLRTALSFMKDGPRELTCEAGPAAIAQFIDHPGECRFLQSIKTFAASPLFQGTLIFSKRYSFEDIMHAFLSRLRDAREVVRKGTPAELRSDLYFYFIHGGWMRLFAAFAFLFILSNVLWIAWALHARAWALIALQVGLFVMNVRGARKNE